MVASVFDKYIPKAYPFEFQATMHVDRIVGGTPSDPNIAEGWLKLKMGWSNEAILQQGVAEVMAERGIRSEEAVAELNKNRHLNGFKRERCPKCPRSGHRRCDDLTAHKLYIEGRCLKAAIKEAGSVRWPYPHKWGRYKNTKDREVGGKATKPFFAEHIFVVEDKLHLGTTEPTGIDQQFVHTDQYSSIKYEEYVESVDIDFTVITDYPFTEEEWAMLWITGGQQGFGASRSQQNGRYGITRWATVRS